jgi:hypothetical protein
MPRETPVERFDALLTEYECWLNFIQEHSDLLPPQRPSLVQYYKGLAYLDVARPKYYRHQALINGQPAPIQVKEYSQTPGAKYHSRVREETGAIRRFDTAEEAEAKIDERLKLEEATQFVLRGEEPRVPPELIVELTANVPEAMVKYLKLLELAKGQEDYDYYKAILQLLKEREAKEAQAMGDIL